MQFSKFGYRNRLKYLFPNGRFLTTFGTHLFTPRLYLAIEVRREFAYRLGGQSKAAT
jgi:hypothetical protein